MKSRSTNHPFSFSSHRSFYSRASVILLIIFSTGIGIFVLRPFLDSSHVLFSYIVYVLYGIIVFLLIQPTRKAAEHFVERLHGNQVVNYEKIQKEIVSIFIEQKDLYAACALVSELLSQALHIPEIEIILRFDESEYFSVHPSGNNTHVTKENLILAHLRAASAFDTDVFLIQHEQLPQGTPLQKYMQTHRIIGVLPLILEKNLIGWIQFSHTQPFSSTKKQFLEYLQPMLTVGIRRLRIDQKLQKRIEELVALSHISQTINSSLDVGETLESVMDAVIKLLRVDRAVLFLIDEGKHQAVPTVSRGLGSNISLDYVIDLQTSVFRYVIDHHHPMVVEDALHDPRVNPAYVQQLQTHSFVIVPMISKDKVIGIIGVDNAYSHMPVTLVNQDLLMTLANQAAIAVTNSRLYERTQQFNRELQKRVKEATEHLERLLDMKSHFLAVASHQLRTPTSIIRGYLSMILEDPELSKEEQQKYTHQSFVAANRLERIIGELLSVIRIQDDSVQLSIEEIRPNEMVQDILSHLQPLADERGIFLHLSTPKAIPPIFSDRVKLYEAISNIVDNAIRYTLKGSVKVHIDTNKTHVIFSVVDTGVGITKKEKALVFDKFQRGDQVKSFAPHGSGLGLYIVKRIAEILGGTVEVESEGMDKGSTFILTVPRDNRAVERRKKILRSSDS